MSIRTERVAAVIQKDLGEILQQNYQMKGSMVTVTRVRMTPDLSIAKVYISVFDPQRDQDTVFQHINDHIQEIRYELAGRIRHQVRRIPELHFYVDDSSEYVNRIESLFNKVEEERRGRGDSEDEKE